MATAIHHGSRGGLENTQPRYQHRYQRPPLCNDRLTFPPPHVSAAAAPVGKSWEDNLSATEPPAAATWPETGSSPCHPPGRQVDSAHVAASGGPLPEANLSVTQVSHHSLSVTAATVAAGRGGAQSRAKPQCLPPTAAATNHEAKQQRVAVEAAVPSAQEEQKPWKAQKEVSWRKVTVETGAEEAPGRWHESGASAPEGCVPLHLPLHMPHARKGHAAAPGEFQSRGVVLGSRSAAHYGVAGDVAGEEQGLACAPSSQSAAEHAQAQHAMLHHAEHHTDYHGEQHSEQHGEKHGGQHGAPLPCAEPNGAEQGAQTCHGKDERPAVRTLSKGRTMLQGSGVGKEQHERRHAHGQWGDHGHGREYEGGVRHGDEGEARQSAPWERSHSEAAPARGWMRLDLHLISPKGGQAQKALPRVSPRGWRLLHSPEQPPREDALGKEPGYLDEELAHARVEHGSGGEEATGQKMQRGHLARSQSSVVGTVSKSSSKRGAKVISMGIVSPTGGHKSERKGPRRQGWLTWLDKGRKVSKGREQAGKCEQRSAMGARPCIQRTSSASGAAVCSVPASLPVLATPDKQPMEGDPQGLPEANTQGLRTQRWTGPAGRPPVPESEEASCEGEGAWDNGGLSVEGFSGSRRVGPTLRGLRSLSLTASSEIHVQLKSPLGEGGQQPFLQTSMSLWAGAPRGTTVAACLSGAVPASDREGKDDRGQGGATLKPDGIKDEELGNTKCASGGAPGVEVTPEQRLNPTDCLPPLDISLGQRQASVKQPNHAPTDQGTLGSQPNHAPAYRVASAAQGVPLSQHVSAKEHAVRGLELSFMDMVLEQAAKGGRAGQGMELSFVDMVQEQPASPRPSASAGADEELVHFPHGAALPASPSAMGSAKGFSHTPTALPHPSPGEGWGSPAVPEQQPSVGNAEPPSEVQSQGILGGNQAQLGCVLLCRAQSLGCQQAHQAPSQRVVLRKGDTSEGEGSHAGLSVKAEANRLREVSPKGPLDALTSSPSQGTEDAPACLPWEKEVIRGKSTVAEAKGVEGALAAMAAELAQERLREHMLRVKYGQAQLGLKFMEGKLREKEEEATKQLQKVRAVVGEVQAELEASRPGVPEGTVAVGAAGGRAVARKLVGALKMDHTVLRQRHEAVKAKIEDLHRRLQDSEVCIKHGPTEESENAVVEAFWPRLRGQGGVQAAAGAPKVYPAVSPRTQGIPGVCPAAHPQTPGAILQSPKGPGTSFSSSRMESPLGEAGRETETLPPVAEVAGPCRCGAGAEADARFVRVDEVLRERDAMREEMHALREQLQQLARELVNKVNEVKAMEEERDHLKGQVGHLEEELHSQVAAAHSAILALQRTNSALHSQAEDARLVVEEQVREVFGQSEKALKAQLEEQQLRSQEAAKRIRLLQEKIDAMEGELTDAHCAVSERETEVKRLTSMQENLLVEVGELSVTVQELEEEKKELQKELLQSKKSVYEPVFCDNNSPGDSLAAAAAAAAGVAVDLVSSSEPGSLEPGSSEPGSLEPPATAGLQEKAPGNDSGADWSSACCQHSGKEASLLPKDEGNHRGMQTLSGSILLGAEVEESVDMHMVAVEREAAKLRCEGSTSAVEGEAEAPSLQEPYARLRSEDSSLRGEQGKSAGGLEAEIAELRRALEAERAEKEEMEAELVEVRVGAAETRMRLQSDLEAAEKKRKEECSALRMHLDMVRLDKASLERQLGKGKKGLPPKNPGSNESTPRKKSGSPHVEALRREKALLEEEMQSMHLMPRRMPSL